jgi:prepilin-type N-terminal cleavage/methylation domain-containing protein
MHSRDLAKRGFTLLELMVSFVIMAAMTAIAVPIYSSVLSGASLNAANAPLSNIAHIAFTDASVANVPLPTAAMLASAIATTTGFTSVASSNATHAPSTAYSVVSYDAVDFASINPSAVGLAMQSTKGGCALAVVTAAAVYVWGSATVPSCDATQALADINQVTPATTTTTTTTTTVVIAMVAPLSPASLAVSPGNASAVATWVAPSNHGTSPITGYTLQYSSDSGASWITASSSITTLSYSLTGLTNGSPYLVRVAATSSAGTSPYTSPISVTPAATITAPAAPSTILASYTAPSSSVTLSWATPSNDGTGSSNGAGITSYTVTGSPAGSCSSVAASAPLTSCTVNSLVAGTSYTFTVTATNSASLTSAPSGTSAPVTITAAPTPPTIVIASYLPGATSSTISWTAPSNDGQGSSNGANVTSYTATAVGHPGTTCTATATPAPTTCTVQNLALGVNYTFTVTATNAAGFTSAPSSASNQTGVVATTPDPPTNPSVTYVPGASTAIVSWTATANDGEGHSGPTGITSYTVTGSPSGACISAAPSAPTTSCQITGLAPGRTYSFSVTDTNSGTLTSSPSFSTSTIAVTQAPDVPLNVVATYTPGSQSASVSWTAPSNGGADATGLTSVTSYTATSSPGAFTCTTSGSQAPTSCTVLGLTTGVSYTFTVTASNDAPLTSAPSLPSNATGVVTTVPGAPTGVTATTGENSQSTISWVVPASNGGSAITSYTVQYAVSPYSTWATATTTATGTTYVVTGLTNAVSYEFRVAATNSVGTGLYSVPSSSITPLAVPGPPTGVTAIAGNASAVVSWSAPVANGSGAITLYTVTSSPGGFTCTTAGSLTCTVSGLTNGMAYTFTVTAANAVGTGPSSSPSTAVVPATVPDAPTGVTVNGAQHETINWVAPVANGGSTITAYTLQYAPSPYSSWTTITTTITGTSYTDTALTFGTSYEFRVAATNSIGTGAYSAPSAVAVPATNPANPTGVTSSYTPGATQITVSWTIPANDGFGNSAAANITSYTATSSPGGFTCTSASAGAPAPSCVITGLTPGSTYTFTVTATNTYGLSSPSSSPSSPSAVIVINPTAPTSVTAVYVGGTTSAAISWTAPSNDGYGGSTGGAITGYTVTSSPGALTCTTSGAPAATGCSVSGLSGGQTYTFTVTATNSAGLVSPASVPSNPTGNVTTVPGTPTGVAGTSNADSQSVVTWSAPASTGGSPITAYTVQYAVSPYSSWTTATSSAATTTYTVTGLTNGTPYEFRVAATNAVGTGVFSAPSAIATPATAPDAPTGVVGTSYANTQSVVTWSAPAYNGGAAITAYTVQYAVSPYSSWTTATSAAAATTYTVTTLTNGTPYEFRVAATNPAGTGAFSTPSAIATPATAPDAPTGVVGTSYANTQSVVTWSAPASNGSAITTYTVQYAVSPYSSWTTATSAAAATTYTVTTLTNGTPYEFRVAATNPAGTGSFSTPSATATPATAPDTPTAVTATSNQNAQSVVAWTAPLNNGGSPVATYLVTSSPGGFTCTSGATTCTVVGLTNGTAYTFTLTATNAAGTSVPSSPSAAATPATPPGAPTGVTPTVVTGLANGPSNGQVALTWSAPAASGGAPVTSYLVQYAPSPYSSWTTAAAAAPGTSYTVTGLTNGTSYEFRVGATNAAGTGIPSAPSSAVTPIVVPGAPAAPAATSYANASSSVSFAMPTSNGGSAVINYTIQYAASPYSTWTTATTTQTSSPYVVTGLTNGTSYEFQVAATNAAGTGAFSSSSSPVTPATVPGAPTSVTASSNQNAQSAVAWTAPLNNGGAPVVTYTVTSSPGGFTCTSGATTCAVTGLTNGASYTFTVTATNAAGTGPASVPSSTAIPSTPPGPPTGVTATVVTGLPNGAANGQVVGTWTAPASTGGSAITSYLVQYAPSPYTTWATATAAATGTSYTVTGLTNGTSYEFRTGATNAAGTGIPSAPSSAVTPIVVPGAPAAPAATSYANASSSVSFAMPTSNGGSAVINYTIQYAASPYSTWTTATTTQTSSPYVVTGLTNGTSYEFQVAATNAAGTGAFSSSSSPVTPATVPGAPTGVTAAAPYYCNGSDSLSGSTCTSTSTYAATYNSQGYYSCNPGDSLSGSTCTHSGSYAATYNSQGYYSCNPGDSLSGSTCTHSGSYAATYNSQGYYSCNPGDSLSGSTCTHSGSYAATLTYGCNAGWTSNGSGCFRQFASTQSNCTNNGGSWSSSSGGTCTVTKGWQTSTYSCPSGGSLSGSTCYTTSTYTATWVNTSYYSCPSGGSLSGSTCYTTSTYTATWVNTSYYSCPSGGTLSGTTCTVTGTYTARVSSTVTVTWVAPASNGGATITLYTVSASSGGFTCTSSGGLSCVVTGLLAGTAYTFTVTASNSAGTGPASAPSNAITPS